MADKPQPYRFAEEVVKVYPDILVPGGGSLVAHPGDIHEFAQPPPGIWVRVADDKPKKTAKAGD